MEFSFCCTISWHPFNVIRTFSSFKCEYIKFPLFNDLFWTGFKLLGEHNQLPWGDHSLRTDYVVDDEIGRKLGSSWTTFELNHCYQFCEQNLQSTWSAQSFHCTKSKIWITYIHKYVVHIHMYTFNTSADA